MERVLQHGRLLPQLEQALAREFDITRLHEQPEPAAWLARHGAAFSGLVTSARVGADRALLSALPALRVVSSFGVGFDTFDLGALRERGIPLGYTPDVLNDCVADAAFGLLIDVARGVCLADRFVRSGAWERGPFVSTTRVSGKRLGIVGLGRIGRAIARRATGFDMAVRYHNRRPLPDLPQAHEPDLLALARWADFLVLAASAGPGADGMIGAEVLRALGPQGFLINIARGSLVDEAALVAALRDGTLAGAGLDVFAREPDIDPVLRALDNVVLMPHAASATHETRADMVALVLENLRGFYASGRVARAVPGTAD